MLRFFCALNKITTGFQDDILLISISNLASEHFASVQVGVGSGGDADLDEVSRNTVSSLSKCPWIIGVQQLISNQSVKVSGIGCRTTGSEIYVLCYVETDNRPAPHPPLAALINIYCENCHLRKSLKSDLPNF